MALLWGGLNLNFVVNKCICRWGTVRLSIESVVSLVNLWDSKKTCAYTQKKMKHGLLVLNEKSPCRLHKKGSQHHQTQMDTQTKWGNNHCLAPWNLTAVSPCFTQPNVFQPRNSLRNLRWPQDLAKYHSFEVAYESLSHHVLKPSLKCQERPEHGFVIFLKISFYFVFCHDGCMFSPPKKSFFGGKQFSLTHLWWVLVIFHAHPISLWPPLPPHRAVFGCVCLCLLHCLLCCWCADNVNILTIWDMHIYIYIL